MDNGGKGREEKGRQGKGRVGRGRKGNGGEGRGINSRIFLSTLMEFGLIRKNLTLSFEKWVLIYFCTEVPTNTYFFSRFL